MSRTHSDFQGLSWTDCPGQAGPIAKLMMGRAENFEKLAGRAEPGREKYQCDEPGQAAALHPII